MWWGSTLAGVQIVVAVVVGAVPRGPMATVAGLEA